jgi:rhodanese-related sulfurtransferase
LSGKNIAVFGIYPSSLDAERGAADLISAGFSSPDISVLLPDVRSKHEFAHEKASKAPEGASAGVTAGGLLGGALGILAGVGALVVPGVGPIVAAGPILAGFAGLGVGGAVGGLVGALVGLGIPEYEAKRYEGRVKDGGTLLSVHCESAARVKRAKQVLNSSGADDVASSEESRSEKVQWAVI